MNGNILETLGIPVDYLLIGIVAFQLVLFILIICALVKTSSVKKKYTAFMKGSDGKTLEDAMLNKFKLVDMHDDAVKEIYTRLKDIDDNLLITFQKIGLVKYDAFREIGGKMSFVLVLLNKENSGVMMNCMHSNSEGCYTYVKRITKGNVKTTLSKEEERALNLAMNNNEDVAE
ncbi:MAG: DUF4446 family protein [Lachnospiraceae bacterium]|nr:DUF4446 family protein [Lachnospiraceae bacterium]